MLKLFIFSLLLLLSLKAFSFTAANTGTYTSADIKAADITECLEEIEAQYKDDDGLIDYAFITLTDIEEMEAECIKENK